MTTQPEYAKDFSICSTLDDIDRVRQIALRVKDAPSSSAAGSAAVNVNTTTIYALPRAQATVLLGLVGKALGAAGSGDLVELSLAPGTENYPADLGDARITNRGVRYCIEFMGIHTSSHFPRIPKPLKLHLRDYLQGPDRDFVYEMLIVGDGTPAVNNDALFETLVAAAALDFRPLVELCSAAVAQSLTGKTVGQMRGILGVQSDYAPEEEKALSDANKKMFPEEAHRF